jgi:hypothetical protein
MTEANYTIAPGQSLYVAACLMSIDADERGEELRAEFNGFMLVARPGMSINDVTDPYDQHCIDNAARREAERVERERRADCYPDLLEALKLARESVEADIETGPMEDEASEHARKVLTQIDAALAKAESTHD